MFWNYLSYNLSNMVVLTGKSCIQRTLPRSYFHYISKLKKAWRIPQESVFNVFHFLELLEEK